LPLDDLLENKWFAILPFLGLFLIFEKIFWQQNTHSVPLISFENYSFLIFCQIISNIFLTVFRPPPCPCTIWWHFPLSLPGVTWQFSFYKKDGFSRLFAVKFSSKIDRKWHVTFLLTTSLPHVSFGDNVATPLSSESVTYYLNSPKSVWHNCSSVHSGMVNPLYICVSQPPVRVPVPWLLTGTWNIIKIRYLLILTWKRPELLGLISRKTVIQANLASIWCFWAHKTHNSGTQYPKKIWPGQ